MILTLTSAVCDTEDAAVEPAIDERAAPPAQAVPLTLEEAGFLAAGALADIYGARPTKGGS